MTTLATSARIDVLPKGVLLEVCNPSGARATLVVRSGTATTLDVMSKGQLLRRLPYALFREVRQHRLNRLAKYL